MQVCGFTGHGFMMAPAVGRLLARVPRHQASATRCSRAGIRADSPPARAAKREDMIIG
jgi:sarcosine oxidase subunit beta